MGSIIDGIFGSPSKNNSTSNSQATSGNQAYNPLSQALSGSIGNASGGSSLLASLLGIPTLGAGGGAPAYQGNYTYNPTTGQAGGSGGSTAPPGGGNLLQNLQNFQGAGGPTGGVGGPKFQLDDPIGSDFNNGIGTAGTQVPGQGPGSVGNEQPGAPVSPSGGIGNTGLNDFLNSSGFNFLRDQGTRAVEGSQAGKGMLQSGATGKALESFGNNLATTYLNDYINHVMDYSKLGDQSAAVLGSAGNVSQSTGLASANGTGGKNGLINNIIAAL